MNLLKKLPFQNFQKLELTLAILKPDVLGNPLSIESIKSTLLDNNFIFVRSQIVRLNRTKAEQFYQDHKGKFFYERLVTFMSSGPISVHILARRNAIQEWRKLMGPTKVYRAQYERPDCIRSQFGLTDTRNATHGSDSQKSALAEINFFFVDFNPDAWFREEEAQFRLKNRIYFDYDRCQHQIQRSKENKQAFF